VVAWPAPIDRQLLAYPVWFDSPVVADGHVYVVGSDGRLFAFSTDCGNDGATCEPTWTAATGPHTSMPVIEGGMVFVTAGGRLLAYRADCPSGGAACKPAWTGSGRGAFLIDFPPVVGDGLVYAKTLGGELDAFDASTGELRWRANPRNATWRPSATEAGSLGSPPVVGDGFVVVGWGAAFSADSGSRLYAFGADCGRAGGTCQPSWTARVPDDLLTIF